MDFKNYDKFKNMENFVEFAEHYQIEKLMLQLMVYG